MKITKNGIVLTLAAIVFVTGLALMTVRSRTAYDEPAHRATITKIYPSVRWAEYREAAREICQLDEGPFRLAGSLAADEGPEAAQAMAVNTAYLCPNRLELLEK